MSYLSKINAALPGVISFLKEKGIHEKYLDFGGPVPSPDRVYVPTDVRSEFLANRAMGDWAESVLSQALSEESGLRLRAIQYGDTGNLSAGDPNFKDRYLASLEETRTFGKRPDLLLVHDSLAAPSDISNVPRLEADFIARQSLAAIEVRSSKQQALKYMEIKAKEGGKAGKSGLSFTVKVEDLRIVHRWIETCDVPQYYFQVFFDSVFAIDVLDIFLAISGRDGIAIEKPDKSQNKATIMIPITRGRQVASFTSPPKFSVEIRENRLGRIDTYVVPIGGDLVLDSQAIRETLDIK
jgi:hypothetical protein